MKSGLTSWRASEWSGCVWRCRASLQQSSVVSTASRVHLVQHVSVLHGAELKLSVFMEPADGSQRVDFQVLLAVEGESCGERRRGACPAGGSCCGIRAELSSAP